MMVHKKRTAHPVPVILLSVIILLQACKPSDSSATQVPESQISPSVGGGVSTETTTPPTPTPTPLPLAAKINGEGILLEDYKNELLRLQSALESTGQAMTLDEQQEIVINNLIDQMLLLQAVDYYVDDETLQNRYDAAASGAGGPDAFIIWLSENYYTEESFKRTLGITIAAAWQRDQIINSVPETVEQVRVQQILLLDETTAAQVYQQLVGGANFSALALQYDPVTGGSLGWFPRGYITQSALEEAAFNLQPGQFSEVITTDFGYHIIQVIAKEDNHPLSPEARRKLQHKTLATWLEQQRSESEIEILLP